MFGGFLKGVLAGLGVAVAALVILAVMMETPSPVPPELGENAAAPAAPAAPQPAAEPVPPPLPEASATAETPSAAPALTEVSPAEDAPAAAAPTAEPPRAVPAEAPAAPEEAAPVAEGTAAAPASDTGPSAVAVPQAPALPRDEASPTPAEAPPAPDDKLLAPAVEALVPVAPVVEDPALLTESGAAEPVVPPAVAAAPVAPEAEALPEIQSDTPPAPAPEVVTEPEDAAPQEESPFENAPPESAPAENAPPESAPPENAVADAPVGPTPGLDGAVEGVTVDRLPQVGDALPEPEPAAEEAAPAIDPAELPPLQREARPFENPEQKPLFAVILIDTGEPALDRATLAAIPFPVSFALDPMDPATPDRARLYRDAGQEVLMLATGFPEGAQAADVEVALSVMGDAMPEAVAVLDTAEGAFQDDRPLATGVVPIIAAQGRGLVTWDRGLNAADQVARRNALPSGVIFRALDAEGEATPVIRRYLDRAAFKAAQEGRVIVAGRTRPETVAALMEWAVEGRSSTVALAPVTAILSLP